MKIKGKVQMFKLECKEIKKGDNAGRQFYVLSVIDDNDILEIMIFDNPNLINKLMKTQKFQEFTGEFEVKQNNGNTRLNILDLV